jgi:hypothetical protein
MLIPAPAMLACSLAAYLLPAALGDTSLAIVGKIFLTHKPVALFVVIGGIIAASAFSLETRGVKTDRCRTAGNSAAQNARGLLE